MASSFVQHLISLLSAIQELEELLTEIKDISVVLGIDNTCKLDLSRIVEEVRSQYEALALRSWEEAEALTRRKVCPLSDWYGERRERRGKKKLQDSARCGETPHLGMEGGTGC